MADELPLLVQHKWAHNNLCPPGCCVNYHSFNFLAALDSKADDDADQIVS